MFSRRRCTVTLPATWRQQRCLVSLSATIIAEICTVTSRKSAETAMPHTHATPRRSILGLQNQRPQRRLRMVLPRMTVLRCLVCVLRRLMRTRKCRRRAEPCITRFRPDIAHGEPRAALSTYVAHRLLWEPTSRQSSRPSVSPCRCNVPSSSAATQRILHTIPSAVWANTFVLRQ